MEYTMAIACVFIISESTVCNEWPGDVLNEWLGGVLNEWLGDVIDGSVM